MPAAASSASGIRQQRLQAGAQHLAALAEGGGGDAFQRLELAGRCRAWRAATSCTMLDVTLGGGVKARG